LLLPARTLQAGRIDAQNMAITLICTGKTSEKYVAEGMRHYEERLKHYSKLD
jgi:hypothetical protein